MQNLKQTNYKTEGGEGVVLINKKYNTWSRISIKSYRFIC